MHFNDRHIMHFQDWTGITKNRECYNLRGRGENLVLALLEARQCPLQPLPGSTLETRDLSGVWDLQGTLLGRGFAIHFSTTPSDLPVGLKQQESLGRVETPPGHN